MSVPAAATLEVRVGDLPMARPFRIANRVFNSTPIVTAEVRSAQVRGRGEAAGVYYMGDSPDRMADTLCALAAEVAGGLDRAALQHRLPPGGARNALDCALWEHESLRHRIPVWRLAGLAPPRPLVTTMTIGAADPGVMAQIASADYADARALKLKLTGDASLDAERVRAVRALRPDVWIGVDANQGFTPDTLDSLLSTLVDCQVRLVEQPFARGAEALLDGLALPIPVAADESCLDLAELETLPGRFDIVNIKLDKCGGLTEGLAMARRAIEIGLGVMVGNMCGSSLAMAPAFLVGQSSQVVDLDGPILLGHDRTLGAIYGGGEIWCPSTLWGASEP